MHECQQMEDKIVQDECVLTEDNDSWGQEMTSIRCTCSPVLITMFIFHQTCCEDVPKAYIKRTKIPRQTIKDKK